MTNFLGKTNAQSVTVRLCLPPLPTNSWWKKKNYLVDLVRDPLMIDHRETLLIFRVTSPKSLELVFYYTDKDK